MSTHTGSKRKNLILLSLTLAVVMVGFGVVIPVFPFYIESMGASGNELGLLVAISPLIQLFFSPLWGGISDRIGRKPVLMVGILGYGIAMLLFGLATELWMLFVIRGLGAFLSAATLPTTFAYVGDSTTEEERSGAMGMLGAATALGMLLGPGLGGSLAEASLSTPFFITAAVCAITLAFIALFLPESLPKEARTRARAQVTDGDSAAKPEALGDAFGPLLRAIRHPAEASRVLAGIGWLLFLTFLLSFGLSNFQGIFGLYVLERFGYGPREVGWMLTGLAVVGAVTQGLLAGPLTRRWGDVIVIRATLLGSALGFGLMLLADSFVTLLVTTALFALPNALLRVSVMSLTSQRASMGQGTAMGLSNSFMSLGRIAGPIWAGYSFDFNPILPYLSGALIMAVGFLVSLRWLSVAEPAPVTSERPPPQPASSQTRGV